MAMTAAGLNRFQQSAATQATEQMHGGTIFIDGRPYKVSVVSSRGTLDVTDGGWVMARTLEIIARDAILPKAVLIDTTQASQPFRPLVLTYDGVSYRIKGVVTDPTGFQHHISCVEKSAAK